MAVTSLRAYQDKLDSLLLEDKLDAALAHARHILKAHPRNLRAWQQVGMALMGQGRLADAAAVMRRLLAARPLDFQTHWRLAQLYHELGQSERALLHAERALDQRPHDAGAGDFLRQLHGEDDGASELSAAGMAQECIRRSQLDEAGRILDAALETEPKRVDLQLLRARALWLDGNRMAAAEAADDILGRLPYAVAANRIMAELWLSERRPSDARLYLERIEALDPYLAHQLAGSGLPADDLITLDELAFDDAAAAVESDEEALDLPQLSDIDEIESLFSQAELPPVTARPPIERPPAAAPEAPESPAEPAQDEDLSSLDDDLALMLEQLDSEADAGNSWLTEVQGGDDSAADDADFADDWLDDDEGAEAEDDVAGAPWLSASIREMQSETQDDDFDLFAEDEQLQALLQGTSDTEPINLEDIDAWLDDAEEQGESEDAEAEAELLASPDADWQDEALTPLSAAEQNRRNVALIEDWQSELGDDDDDPYVDWLSEELAADIEPRHDTAAAQAASGAAPSDETARAWGLKDASELADFVAEEVRLGDAEATPGWLNAALPGMDRQGDAEPDQPEEFARPMARHGRDFAWLNDIVDEETGEMQAVDLPGAPADIPYFRFENPPVWLANMALPMAPGGINQPMAAGGTLIDDIDDLDLDDLTFDDYFNVDAPTDRLDAITLDDGVDNINFAEMGWDDYFELESPTEKTIAISLEDEVGGFRALDVDEADLAIDAPTDRTPAINLKDELNTTEFDDIGLDETRRHRDRSAPETNA